MSIIRAVFEPGIWKDFSKEHRALREEVERSLASYGAGKFADPIAVWGAFGAGKTQFLFWVAERTLEVGLLPVYFHLNDLLDGLPEKPSPDGFRDYARQFAANIVRLMRTDPTSEFLRSTFRDESLLSYVLERVDTVDTSKDIRPVLLVDEVEQAYITLRDGVRADDRSPLRAWLEDAAFKVCAFAVGSLYVLGKADRERMRVHAIPAVRPSFAKRLLSDIPEATVNALWWLSRGKPRHLMKAAQRFRAMNPVGAVEVHEFVRELDSVSQAPYETDSQNVVPACYIDHFQPDELPRLLTLHPSIGQGEGKLFRMNEGLDHELLTVVRDAFKMESVAVDLVRYLVMLIEATSVDGCFALSEADTPHLLRLAVDFLLEYERERLEKESLEGGATLRKLLEVHDSAQHHAGQIFWKLAGKLGATETAALSISFAALAAAYPLPTTSPTLLGTNPAGVRSRFEESKQPVFSWRDAGNNAVIFLTSPSSLDDFSGTPEFRQLALHPVSGVIVLLPHDANEWQPTGLCEWLREQDRLRVIHLPLALTDFLLSLRDSESEGSDPIPIAHRAELDKNLQRQVSFYRVRLLSFVSESICRPKATVPAEVPKTLTAILTRIADKDAVALATQQAFEILSPQVHGYLVDLRELVVNSKSSWGRSGLSSVADEMLPHRSPKSGKVEPAKIIDDIRISFAAYADSLRRLASFVSADELEYISNDAACKVALRSLWHAKRSNADPTTADLALYNAQLTDIVTTLATLRATETLLKKVGVMVSFGSVGPLLDVLPHLRKVSEATAVLLKSPAGADRRLAISLFEEFLSVFTESVGSDVTKAKSSAARVTATLKALEDFRKRVVLAAQSDSVQFSELDPSAFATLLDALLCDAVQSLPTDASLEHAAQALDDAAQSFEAVENNMARLDSAFYRITDWTTEHL